MVKRIFAPVESAARHANIQKRESFSAPFFEIDPTAVDDLVVYLRNTGVQTIEIYAVNIIAFTAGGVQLLQKVTGTAGGGGTTRNAVSMDLGSSLDFAANMDFLTDPDITGLTEVATLDTFGQIAGEENFHTYPSGILLPTGTAVAIGVAVATSIISGNIFFHVLPEDE